MDSILKLKTLTSFESVVDKLKLQGFNWKGDKYFVYGDNKTVTMSQLSQKLAELYHSEYFNGAQVTEQDCEKIKTIKKKIELLDDQNVKIGTLQSCYLKVISVVSRIFSFGKIDQKTALLSEMGIRASRPNESAILGDIVNSNLSPQVQHALKDSYDNYYKNAFKDTSIRKKEAMRTVNGEEIHRYNHGLAHTTRKVFFIPFVVDYLRRHGLDHLTSQLEEMINEEGIDKVIEKLQLAITFEVAGRESECGSRDNINVYTSYLVKSQEAFRKYCKDNNLVGEGKLFKNDEDLERYAKAIKNKYYNKFENEKMDVVTVVLDMAHTLDEFRCYWPSRMKSELEEINHFYTKDKNNRDLWELAKFCQKAVRATGDRVMTEFAPGFNQRNNKFGISNFTSLVFRNFSFSDNNAFINCSTDANYCWDLLKKITPPVSYSRGETTFSHLSSTKNKNEKNLSSNESKANDALKLIAEGNGAMRLINTKKEQFGFEMTMLNDPVFFRPTRPVKGSRNLVLKNRKNGEMIDRGFKNRKPLREQINSYKPKNGKKNNKLWKPVHQNKDRGLAKYTEYTKKVSLSLLRPDGKVNHFKGEFPKEYGVYRPVGFLYDVNLLNQKKEKYVFDYDVGTSSKFWIGEEAAKNIDKKIGRNTNLSLQNLKDKLSNEAKDGVIPQSLPFWKMQHASNEMLMCPKKSAIKAVFATEDTPQARIQTFLHAVYFAHDHGIRVPVLIIDGVKEPKAYTKEEFEKDLAILSKQRSSLSKTIYNDLYSCFFSSMDKPKNNEEKLNNLKNKCQEFFA